MESIEGSGLVSCTSTSQILQVLISINNHHLIIWQRVFGNLVSGSFLVPVIRKDTTHDKLKWQLV